MRGYHCNKLIERKWMFHLGIAHNRFSSNFFYRSAGARSSRTPRPETTRCTCTTMKVTPPSRGWSREETTLRPSSPSSPSWLTIP